MRFIYKERYLKRFDRFSQSEQVLIHETDRHVRAYYATGQAPFGFRLKRLHTTGPQKVFEARVTQAIRIVWVEEGDAIYFGLVGSHDEVKRYLHSLR